MFRRSLLWSRKCIRSSVDDILRREKLLHALRFILRQCTWPRRPRTTWSSFSLDRAGVWPSRMIAGWVAAAMIDKVCRSSTWAARSFVEMLLLILPQGALFGGLG